MWWMSRLDVIIQLCRYFFVLIHWKPDLIMRDIYTYIEPVFIIDVLGNMFRSTLLFNIEEKLV